MPDQTNIVPPRVPFNDPRTGMISREWYRFFLSLFNLAGGGTNTTTLVDVQLGPVVQPFDVTPIVDHPQLGVQSPSALLDMIGELQKQIQEISLTTKGDSPISQNDHVQLATSPASSVTDLIFEIQKQLQAVELNVSNVVSLPSYYGSFSDTTDQTIAAVYTPQAVTLNTTNSTQGFSVASSSRVTAANPGVYSLEFTLQLESTSASTKTIWVWLRKNGADEANTNSVITITGANTTTVAAWNFVVSLAASDYLEVMFAADSTSVAISAHAAEVGATGTAAFARPAVPSTIVSITQVNK